MLLHVDGAAGISGDMTLGALVDLGVPIDHVAAELDSLGLDGWSLRGERVKARGIRATRVQVDVDHAVVGHVHRGWKEVSGLVEGSRLAPRVKERSLAVFRRLCEAEARVHDTTLDRVHLHEVGAVDAIVDVCGACVGLEHLGVDRLSASPPDVGGGTVDCDHGVLPVPAPATLELLAGRRIRSSGLDVELTTPTGAALLSTLADEWGTVPDMTVERIGFGAGTRELPDRANVVRFTLGQRASDGTGRSDHLVVEADVDDADPQVLAAFMERALEQGALDAVQVPNVMKKGRAGVRLTLLCREADLDELLDGLFRETTTIGCRWHRVARAECRREIVPVDTPHGTIRVKVARWRDRIVNRKPEHDDCVAAAERDGVPLKSVLDAVRTALASENDGTKP